MSQPNQSYANHRQIVPVVHYFLMPLGLIVAIASLVYALGSLRSGDRLLEPLVIVGLSVMVMLLIPLSRSFGVKVQDRLIRTEENLRYFRLTGQWLDSRITLKQLIALRFASDQEFPALCDKAVKEQLSPGDIKKLIKSWRGDYYRV
ncbi:DUF6526 family protein [Paenibacillus sp. GD4]|uniref:DUF6526 family protein n=1 Tax=Paenibacillus sp. GD4 TaxID=3068890 RepID=UPI0027965543|nr:DUF6526 family protein [Paenibacillus sp. GD4]MDQ1910112.1 DUF6526 family protein [Paenibacillus sp. GD4]